MNSKNTYNIPKNSMKIIFYGLVGVVGAFVDLFLFWLGVEKLGFNWMIVAPIAFSISTLVHYSLSIRLVFEQGVRFGKFMEVFAIFGASVVSLILNQISLFFFLEVLGMENLISKLLADVVIILWNYSVRAFYIFKPVQCASKDVSVGINRLADSKQDTSLNGQLHD